MIPIDIPAWVSWFLVISTLVATWGAILWTLFVMWPFIRWSKKVANEQTETLRKAVSALQTRGGTGKNTDLTDLI